MRFSRSQRSLLPKCEIKTQPSLSSSKTKKSMKGPNSSYFPVLKQRKQPEREYGLMNPQSTNKKIEKRVTTPQQRNYYEKHYFSSGDKKPISLGCISSPETNRSSSGVKKNESTNEKHCESLEYNFQNWNDKQEQVISHYMKKYSQLSIENAAIQFEKQKYNNMVNSKKRLSSKGIIKR